MKAIMKSISGKILQILFSFFKIHPDKIFFETGTGEVKDNAKAVYDYLKEHNRDEFVCRWAVKKGNDTLDLGNDEIVWKKTLRYYYELLTSKYWIRTHSVDNVVKKRKTQIYIQLWHGPGATKKEGYDAPGIVNDGTTMWHAKEWDYFIAADVDSQSYIKTALNLHIPRLLLGSPRSDKLVNMDSSSYWEIRKKFGIKPEEKAVLYAPTFREEDFNRTKVELKVRKLCRLKGVRVILRVHPEIKNRMDITDYGNSVIDGNKYPDIFELYMAADILITDYSSVAMEYTLLKRPVLYYMYDLEDYIKERNFYYDYLDRLSGPILRTEEELIKAVEQIDQVMKEYQSQYDSYYERYNKWNDGHVCERFVSLLRAGRFKVGGNMDFPGISVEK